jgi:hypothetical protein
VTSQRLVFGLLGAAVAVVGLVGCTSGPPQVAAPTDYVVESVAEAPGTMPVVSFEAWEDPCPSDHPGCPLAFEPLRVRVDVARADAEFRPQGDALTATVLIGDDHTYPLAPGNYSVASNPLNGTGVTCPSGVPLQLVRGKGAHVLLYCRPS